MEASMFLDDDQRRRARQDLLEAVSSGMGGPAIAPMPGIMLEMLEIAAMERHAAGVSPVLEAQATPPLTATTNSSPMSAVWLFGKIINVASWLRSDFATWRLLT